MVGTKGCSGNPNIANIRKTGPRTPEGKLKVMISSPIARKKLLVSKGSKILRKVRQCNFCPLRTKVVKKKINDKITEITHYSTCPGYNPNGRKCIMSINDYVKKVALFYDIVREADGIEMQKAFIMQSMMDAEASREMETLERGRPGFYTNQHSERAMKYTSELNKLIIGEKHRHEVDGEVEVKVKRHNFSEDQLRRIADIMLEKKEKVIDVEGKIDEETDERV